MFGQNKLPSTTSLLVAEPPGILPWNFKDFTKLKTKNNYQHKIKAHTKKKQKKTSLAFGSLNPPKKEKYTFDSTTLPFFHQQNPKQPSY